MCFYHNFIDIISKNIYIYILFWFFHLVEGWKNDW